MKTRARYLSGFLILLLFGSTGCDTDESQTVATFNNITLQEEFDTDGAPDSDLWNFDIGTGENGWGNNELQYYTNRNENVSVQNGFLIITADRESFEGSSYTSARITTEGNFEQAFGRFEARIKLPYGQGIWPAFWLLGNNCDEVIWPNCGEIDIMEYRGQLPTENNGSAHGPGYSAGESLTKSYNLTNDRFDTGFHIFGVEWTPNQINYYVDGDLYFDITRAEVEEMGNEWVFDHPFYIILNVAVGGSFLGPPNDETVFPQRMLVDYIRVYDN